MGAWLSVESTPAHTQLSPVPSVLGTHLHKALPLKWPCFEFWELRMKDRINSPGMRRGNRKQVHPLPITFPPSPPAGLRLETSHDLRHAAVLSSIFLFPGLFFLFSFPLFAGFGAFELNQVAGGDLEMTFSCLYFPCADIYRQFIKF